MFPTAARQLAWRGASCCGALLLLPAALPAQVPPAGWQFAPPPVESTSTLASVPDLPPTRPAAAVELLPEAVAAEESLAGGEPQPPRGAKPGLLQRLALTGAWFPSGDTDLGMTDVAAEVVLGLPAPTADSPLLVTPAWEAHYLDGPRAPDLPPRLYDASVQFRWLRPIRPTLALDLSITPGWHGDFDQHDGDAFRLPARALIAWDSTPHLKLILGVMYLDREDVSLLPAGGLVWNPDEAHSLELIFPRPRYWQRFAADPYREQWWYVGGEFGGGSYAIRRADGSADVATLSDLRLATGVQHKTFGGLTWSYEVAYVFARQVEYESATPDFEPDDTAMLRATLAW